jgi:hypothetical protein
LLLLLLQLLLLLLHRRQQRRHRHCRRGVRAWPVVAAAVHLRH